MNSNDVTEFYTKQFSETLLEKQIRSEFEEYETFLVQTERNLQSKQYTKHDLNKRLSECKTIRDNNRRYYKSKDGRSKYQVVYNLEKLKRIEWLLFSEIRRLESKRERHDNERKLQGEVKRSDKTNKITLCRDHCTFVFKSGDPITVKKTKGMLYYSYMLQYPSDPIPLRTLLKEVEAYDLEEGSVQTSQSPKSLAEIRNPSSKLKIDLEVLTNKSWKLLNQSLRV